MAEPPQLPPELAAEFRRRRRGRNLAMLVVLLGLSALFYAIAVVKMVKPGAGG
jgi:hypothetical protein